MILHISETHVVDIISSNWNFAIQDHNDRYIYFFQIGLGQLYKDVVNHYLNSGSYVYSCLLDASKAYDRVHYGTLFRLLLTKCVPMGFIRLVLDGYIRQKACALWNNVKSRYFTMANEARAYFTDFF